MNLRYRLTRNFTAENDGYVVVDIDENHVASFHSLEQGQELVRELEDDQLRLRYRIRNDQILFATNAFFFQEGTADKYARARYGEFRVASNGELLLNTLRGEDYSVLGSNTPN